MNNVLDISKKQLMTKVRLRDLSGQIVTLDPKKLLSISDEELSKNIQGIQPQTFTIARAKDLAYFDLENAKQACDIVANNLYNQFIISPVLRKQNNNRKPTDKMVRAKIAVNASYVKLVSQAHKAQYNYSLLNDLYYALRGKAHLLQSESSNLRSERQIKENNAASLEKLNQQTGGNSDA